MENRSALIVDMELTQADGWAEREVAAQMLCRLPKRKRRRTVAADKAYDTAGFVAECRGRCGTLRALRMTDEQSVQGRAVQLSRS